mmetsp:Transcript_10484/g.27770  ORF Transcript_10484/g.27770 Transcript_10484/m.27770 type:complete len:93 (+) Transcript_10484:679-957(+)
MPQTKDIQKKSAGAQSPTPLTSRTAARHKRPFGGGEVAPPPPDGGGRPIPGGGPEDTAGGGGIAAAPMRSMATLAHRAPPLGGHLLSRANPP